MGFKGTQLDRGTPSSYRRSSSSSSSSSLGPGAGSRLSSPLLGARDFADGLAAPRSEGEWIRKGLYFSRR